ncbi:hypothetical protein [Pseudomonas delhiensis]|uniref:hypothetical protein n=1 Tax=Pseudomonas delhiensis TaxID=366289 RepID=UPI00315A5685
MTTNTQQLAGLLQHVEGGSADLHPDDAAVDRFAEALKAKLARSRAKGRGGWDNAQVCSVEDLARMLIEHLGKGNSGTFEDVATFAMMLHQRGANPAVLAEAIQARDAAAKREGWADMKRIAKREIEQLRTQLSTNLPSELRATIDVANDHFEAPVVGWSELEQPEVDMPQAVIDSLKDAYHERVSLSEAAAVICAAHERIVRALRAENDRLSEELDKTELRALKFIHQCNAHVDLNREMRAERDAAQARVAELEKQEPVAWMWRRHARAAWDFEPRWDSIEAGVMKDMEARGWEFHRLYAAPIAQAGQVPEGWKPVPIEPTEDLLEAIHTGGYVGDDEELRWFYKSILDAAPALGGE